MGGRLLDDIGLARAGDPSCRGRIARRLARAICSARRAPANGGAEAAARLRPGADEPRTATPSEVEALLLDRLDEVLASVDLLREADEAAVEALLVAASCTVLAADEPSATASAPAARDSGGSATESAAHGESDGRDLPSDVRLVLAGPGHHLDGDRRQRDVGAAGWLALYLLDEEARRLVRGRLFDRRPVPDLAREAGVDELETATEYLRAFHAWAELAAGLLDGRLDLDALARRRRA